MKPEDPNGTHKCKICGHEKARHAVVCGERACDCLCFFPEDDSLYTLNPHDVSWHETAIMAVTDLILGSKEGEVHIQCKNGKECHIKVKFVDSDFDDVEVSSTWKN